MAIPTLSYLSDPLKMEDGTPCTPANVASYAALLNFRGFLSLCKFGYDACKTGLKLGLKNVAIGFYNQAISPIVNISASILAPNK